MKALVPLTVVLFVSVVMLGVEGNLLKSCESSVIGKTRYSEWLKRNFSYGEKIRIENHTFSLPQEVDEMHCNTFKADLNLDGKSDYVLVIAGTGNGRFLGSCDIYLFVSCPDHAEEGLSFGHFKYGANGQKFRYMHMPSYGIKAIASGKEMLLEGVSLSEDRRTFIRHYYSFDKNGWMKEVDVRLHNNKKDQPNKKEQ